MARAAVLCEIGKPLVIDSVKPTGLSVGHVLVNVQMSGLCGAQLLEVKGMKDNSKFLPHLLGHEGCGIVEEIGEGVEKVKVGDKVVLHWRVASGIESGFPEYEFRDKRIRSGKVVTLAEQAVVSENRITRIDSNTDVMTAALMGCAITTSFGAISREAELKIGETALVLGCGGVGLSLILGLRLAGASFIVAIDKSSNKKQATLRAGADHFMSPESEFLRNGKVSAGKFDVVFDTTGNDMIISWGLSLLSDEGRLVLIAQMKDESKIVLPKAKDLFGQKGKKILITQGGKTDPDVDIPRYLRLIEERKIDLKVLVSEILSLEDINYAIEKVESGLANRIMFQM